VQGAVLALVVFGHKIPISRQLYRRDSWARRLLDTRAITIVPAANALGTPS